MGSWDGAGKIADVSAVSGRAMDAHLFFFPLAACWSNGGYPCFSEPMHCCAPESIEGRALIPITRVQSVSQLALRLRMERNGPN